MPTRAKIKNDKNKITLDRAFLYTLSSVKGYFCSFLISNIIFYTSHFYSLVALSVFTHPSSFSNLFCYSRKASSFFVSGLVLLSGLMSSSLDLSGSRSFLFFKFLLP